jgi:hypothetical protein
MYKTPAYDQSALLTNDNLSARRTRMPKLPSITFALYKSGRSVLSLPRQIQHSMKEKKLMKATNGRVRYT